MEEVVHREITQPKAESLALSPAAPPPFSRDKWTENFNFFFKFWQKIVYNFSNNHYGSI